MAFGFPARFNESRTFDLAEDELFATVKLAFQNLGWLAYEIRQGGKEIHKWLHNSPFTWGEEFTVNFLAGGVIQVESRCTSGGWRGYSQIFDFGANRQNVETFFAQVEREIKEQTGRGQKGANQFMENIVNIPNGSGKSPFEICDEQFFYCTNGEISTLSARASLADPIEYMQMGYTQLYFLQRLILSDRTNGIYQIYPETAEFFPVKDKYCVIDEKYLIWQAPNRLYSLPTPTEAEEYLKTLQSSDQDSIYIVARLLNETYWH